MKKVIAKCAKVYVCADVLYWAFIGSGILMDKQLSEPHSNTLEEGIEKAKHIKDELVHDAVDGWKKVFKVIKDGLALL